MNMIQTAKAYMHSGLSVIPTMADKRPACSWKAFTTRLPSDREIDVNFQTAEGIGIVCGKVSGNLELLDFDDKGSQFDAWFSRVPPYIKSRLVVETSPSGGRHVYYRIVECDVPGNRKLAMKADGHVLIETRGEGGYVKCAPSQGYTLVQGSFTDLPKISPLEEDVLIEIATSLDQRTSGTLAPTPAQPTEPTIVGTGVPPARTHENSPIDDYNARADLPELLMKYGWKRTDGPSDNEHWERPEKNARSTSATWNGSVFYVFSSNAMPFEPNKGYNKFQVYTILEHSGDMLRAVHTIRNMGYGLVTDQPTALPTTNYLLPTSETPVSDPGAIPEILLHVPGFVDNLTAHTLTTAPYPNRTLSFTAALAMLAHLSGRNFHDERNMRTNVYLLALADSGRG